MYTKAAPVESRTFRHFTVATTGTRESVMRGVNGATPASVAWPLANLAIYVPIIINETATIYQVGCGTGATAGGNFDIGLYDLAGTRLQSTGSSARTASAWNPVNWTDLVVQPGVYYAAMAADGTNNYSATNQAAGLLESVGILEQTSAFALPATATFAKTTRAFCPVIDFTMRSVAI